MKQDLQADLIGRALERSGIRLLKPDDAVAIVRRAQEEHVLVLGIDGFHVFDRGIQPDLEHSIDFSIGAQKTASPWKAAEAFLLARLDSGMYFEIVLESMSGR